MLFEFPSGPCYETQLPLGFPSHTIVFPGVTISFQAHFEDSNLVIYNSHIHPQELCRTELCLVNKDKQEKKYSVYFSYFDVPKKQV